MDHLGARVTPGWPRVKEGCPRVSEMPKMDLHRYTRCYSNIREVPEGILSRYLPPYNILSYNIHHRMNRIYPKVLEHANTLLIILYFIIQYYNINISIIIMVLIV